MSARVLIADDDDALLEAVSGALSSEGYAVSVARDGAEALRRLRGSPGAWDLAILDYRMPAPDGIEVIRAIATEPGRFGLKGVVLFTAEPVHDPEFAHAIGEACGSLRIRVIQKGGGLKALRTAIQTLLA